MTTTLQRAIVFVKDIDRMRSFYEQALGLRATEASTDTWVELDGASLALHAIPPEIARDITIDSPPQPRSETAIKLMFAVSDVDAVHARIAASGGVLLENGDALDPEGNVFRVVGR